MKSVEIKIVPKPEPNRFDVYLDKEIVCQQMAAGLAIAAATGMMKVFSSLDYIVVEKEEYPAGGRYWKLNPLSNF